MGSSMTLQRAARLAGLCLVGLFVLSSCNVEFEQQDLPTLAVIDTLTPSVTPSEQPTVPTPIPTETSSPTATPQPTATSIPTETPSFTPDPSQTLTDTITPTPTSDITLTPTDEAAWESIRNALTEYAATEEAFEEDPYFDS